MKKSKKIIVLLIFLPKNQHDEKIERHETTWSKLLKTFDISKNLRKKTSFQSETK